MAIDNLPSDLVYDSILEAGSLNRLRLAMSDKSLLSSFQNLNQSGQNSFNMALLASSMNPVSGGVGQAALSLNYQKNHNIELDREKLLNSSLVHAEQISQHLEVRDTFAQERPICNPAESKSSTVNNSAYYVPIVSHENQNHQQHMKSSQENQKMQNDQVFEVSRTTEPLRGSSARKQPPIAESKNYPHFSNRDNNSHTLLEYGLNGTQLNNLSPQKAAFRRNLTQSQLRNESPLPNQINSVRGSGKQPYQTETIESFLPQSGLKEGQATSMNFVQQNSSGIINPLQLKNQAVAPETTVFHQDQIAQQSFFKSPVVLKTQNSNSKDQTSDTIKQAKNVSSNTKSQQNRVSTIFNQSQENQYFGQSFRDSQFQDSGLRQRYQSAPKEQILLDQNALKVLDFHLNPNQEPKDLLKYSNNLSNLNKIKPDCNKNTQSSEGSSNIKFDQILIFQEKEKSTANFQRSQSKESVQTSDNLAKIDAQLHGKDEYGYFTKKPAQHAPFDRDSALKEQLKGQLISRQFSRAIETPYQQVYQSDVRIEHREDRQNRFKDANISDSNDLGRKKLMHQMPPFEVTKSSSLAQFSIKEVGDPFRSQNRSSNYNPLKESCFSSSALKTPEKKTPKKDNQIARGLNVTPKSGQKANEFARSNPNFMKPSNFTLHYEEKKIPEEQLHSRSIDFYGQKLKPSPLGRRPFKRNPLESRYAEGQTNKSKELFTPNEPINQAQFYDIPDVSGDPGSKKLKGGNDLMSYKSVIEELKQQNRLQQNTIDQYRRNQDAIMKSEAHATYKELEVVKKKHELLERQFEMRVFDQTLEIERKARKQMKLELALACVRYANDSDRAVQDLKLTLNELLEEQRFREQRTHAQATDLERELQLRLAEIEQLKSKLFEAQEENRSLRKKYQILLEVLRSGQRGQTDYVYIRVLGSELRRNNLSALLKIKYFATKF